MTPDDQSKQGDMDEYTFETEWTKRNIKDLNENVG